MLNLEKIRDNFPILKEKMNEHPLVYLDSAATSLKPISVINSIEYYNSKKSSNVHRGVYMLSQEVTLLYEQSREKVAKFINADEREIVFTKGATESLNIIANSYGLANLKKDDEIITSELEHHSSFLPWQNIASIVGAKLVLVPLDEEGKITVDNFKSVLNNKTKIVALNYISNTMGNIAPIKEIAALAHQYGAKIIVDAAQAAPHIPIDVKDLDIDFLAITGHKMLASTGIGILYGKFHLLNSMPPVNFGGEMVEYAGLNKSTFKEPPYKFEAGTPPIAEAISLSTAIDFINDIGFESIQEHEKELRKYAIKNLKLIKGIKIFNEESDIGIINFNSYSTSNGNLIHPHDMASFYDAEGICIRAGHHCAQLIMKWLAQPATLRASIYLYNTKSDIDKFIKATKTARDFLDMGGF